MANDSRESADAPPQVAKRILLGEPLSTEQANEQLLPKRMALPIFASDALSSVAYGPPQEMLMTLGLGGLAFLAFAPWVAAAVVLLLIVIVLSYRKLIQAYPPSGGGDYEVASKNLGRSPASSWPQLSSSTTSSRCRCRSRRAWTTSSPRCRS